MKRIIMFCVIFLMCVVTVVIACNEDENMELVRIYVVDAEMMHLIPVDTHTNQKSTQEKAKYIIKRLITGFDKNPKIRRLIPNINRCMSVKLENDTAYVNITPKMVENHPDGRDIEKLTVYSIVNSLLEVDGINSVRFTIDGKTQKKFKGYIDMRNIFTEMEIVKKNESSFFV